MRNQETFHAPSPKTGEMKKWEATVELGTADPTGFFALGPNETEEYKAGTTGYGKLLPYYREKYGDR